MLFSKTWEQDKDVHCHQNSTLQWEASASCLGKRSRTASGWKKLPVLADYMILCVKKFHEYTLK